ncbi:uncharacterized protein LOC122665688 [Telopea speciosissima]|uniref:uncharacterized protein LOC122665688 n=1 Tax=Telopea speciosissima TaxID=54955 RepID=UPI001CC7D819|nr:uncharacterized protein LOC122665688 [Telopea speciosissima]
MAPYEALYDRKCRSALYWDEVGERRILGPEIIQKTHDQVKLIRQRISTAQSQQKSYINARRKKMEFEIGDMVFLKLALMKGVMRFGKKGKLSPKYVGPFEVLERVGSVAYKVALPPALTGILNVFHVSTPRKYIVDPSHILSYEPLQLKDDLTYEETHVQVLDRKEHALRNRTISFVKVLWQNHSFQEVSWEHESEMQKRYPYLFGS